MISCRHSCRWGSSRRRTSGADGAWHEKCSLSRLSPCLHIRARPRPAFAQLKLDIISIPLFASLGSQTSAGVRRIAHHNPFLLPCIWPPFGLRSFNLCGQATLIGIRCVCAPCLSLDLVRFRRTGSWHDDGSSYILKPALSGLCCGSSRISSC